MNAVAGSLEPADLDEIQGNILAGFNKDHASFLFLLLPEQARARTWLGEIVDEVATTTEVKAFNDLFKMVRARHHDRETVEATWMNLAFTFTGLQALAVAEADLAQLPQEYRDGMRARAALIGDNGDNAPANWPNGLGEARIDAVMIVAADSAEDRNDEVAHFIRHAARHGVQLVFQQDGMTRRDAPGHEHFGFKDGISQPGIAGFNDQNLIPGQDAIAPGEFILGYGRQPAPEPPVPGEVGYPAPAPPPEPDPLNPQPAWLKNGSYYVFRRLAQDVAGFQEFIRQTAPQEGWSEDLLGAKLVGRYRSGAPLEGANNAAADPADADPTRVDDQHINDFNYQQNDADGQQVPRAAHIRKAYPRDEQPPGEPEAERRRILRRGIPFGQSFHRGGRPESPYAADAEFPHDRGLCFACYQRSIADQFEFIQQNWVNTDSFPQGSDGVDAIISQASATRELALPGGQVTPLQLSKQWVKTTGGEYFLAPSISTLKQFAGS
jgi:Dyp-type peroxidase family